MTPEERSLLVAVARRVSVAVGWDGKCELGQLADAVEQAAPAPITPRAKFVSIEMAPDLSNIAARWEYARKRGVTWSDPERDELKHRQLVAMGDNPDREAVAKVMGSSWAYLSCDACEANELLRLVRIEGPYGDSHRYCSTCISEAAALLGAT